MNVLALFAVVLVVNVVVNAVSEVYSQEHFPLYVNGLIVQIVSMLLVLFVQTLLFFGAPLALACFHSLFGLPFCSKLLLSFGGGDMSGALLPTGLLLIVVYGGYFLVTYLCSRSMIREQRVHQE